LKNKKIFQFEPWFDDEEKKILVDTIDSGWIQESSLTRKFEKKFSDFTGSKYAIATTSGTAALFLALQAYGIGHGDRVIAPDYTAIGTLNAISLTGAKVDLVDIKISDANIDPEQIKKVIHSNTKAIVPVHINGRIADMKTINEIANFHNLHVVEDAAQCLGSKFKGKHLGTFSKIGCFSLATSKIITTGQGGMLVTSSKKLFHKLVELKDQGTTARLKTKSIPDWYPSTGFNFKITDLQAAVGLAQFKKLSFRINKRKKLHKLYLEYLENSLKFFHTDMKNGILPWYDDVLADSSRQRNLIMKFLSENHIYTRKFYRPLHTQPIYRSAKNYKNTAHLSNVGFWLPSSTFLNDDEISKICKLIKTVLK